MLFDKNVQLSVIVGRIKFREFITILQYYNIKGDIELKEIFLLFFSRT